MNKRLKELAKQAGATLEKGYIELSDGQFMLSDNVDLDKSNMDLDKFAELIVRECMEVVGDCSVEYATRPQIIEEIKEHFGVEE